MPRVFRDTSGSEGWKSGVLPATDATLLPPDASPRGRNSALAFPNAGQPYVEKRKGLHLHTITPLTSSPAIIAQYDYHRASDDTQYHLLVGGDATLWRLNSDDTTTQITGVLTVADIPDFETADDYGFVVNGTDAKKLDGTTPYTFGIVRPSVGSATASIGGAGGLSGTYEVRFSFGNSSSGHESSSSDSLTATGTSGGLQVFNIPTSSDAQVDTVYVNLRNVNTMGGFFRAGSVTEGTTVAQFVITEDDLIIAAPDTTENDPPPSGAKYIAYHLGRLFVATDDALFWSKVGDVESFDPDATDPVQPGDGQRLTGLHSDHEVLLIHKSDRTYGLYGVDPNTWEIRLIDADVGNGSHRTTVSAEGWTWWWSRHGLVRWNGSTMDRIGMRTLGDPDRYVNYEVIEKASAGYDENEGRLVVAVPSTTQATRANLLLPWSTDLGILESDGWDPMDAASLGNIENADGIQRIWLGNYAGQAFHLWETDADGLPTGTTSTGTFTAATTTHTTITDTGATFTTTGGKLIERKVTILDSDGNLITTGLRPRITTNTATVLTLSAAVSGLTVGSSYTYVVGGPNFQWDSAWKTSGADWLKKRYEYLFLLFKGPAYGVASRADVAFDYDDGFSYKESASIAATEGAWDVDNWDDLLWDTQDLVQRRVRLGRVGFAARMRLRNANAYQPVAVVKMGLQGTFQTTKR